MSARWKTRFAAAAGCAALALLNACGGSDTADLAAANAENARLQEQLARAPTGGASSEELEKAREDLTEAQGQLTAATGERDAARMERDRLLALFRGPAPSADPAARDEALMRTSAVIAETRAATDRAIRELAAAPAPAEKTTAALTQTSEALRLAGAALDAARSALTSSHHGNPLEDAYLEAAAARVSIAEAQAAAEEGTADILRNADMALAQALAALAPLTSDRLRELREQLTATASGLATAMADLERTRMDLTGTRGTLSTATDDLSRTRGTLSTATDDLSQTRRTLSLTLEELAAADMPNSWTLPAGMAARFGSWHFDCAQEEDGAEACGVTVAEPDADGVHRLTYSGPLTFARAPTTNVRVPALDDLTDEQRQALMPTFPPRVFTEEAAGGERNHAGGPADRQYRVMIDPWARAMVGGVDLACASPACLVIVTPDNMVSSSGGRVTITMPRMVDGAGTTLLAGLDDERGRLEQRRDLKAGAIEYEGRIDLACPGPAGDDAPKCSLIVDPTGTLSYWRMEGTVSLRVPTIAQPRETVEVADVPANYGARPMTAPLPVAAGTDATAPVRYGVFDFTCPAGGAGCTVFVEASDKVFASGGATAVAPRVVVTEANQRPRLATLMADDALTAEYIALNAGDDEDKAGGLVDFSCPADAGSEGCGILVADDGIVTASGGATVRLTATSAFQSRIAPFAKDATVTAPLTRMPPAVTLGAMDLTRTARRLSISSGTPQGVRNTNALEIATGGSDWTAAANVIASATGELPMRAVTVGDPSGTGDVQTYMPGERSVYVYPGGQTGIQRAPSGTAGDPGFTRVSTQSSIESDWAARDLRQYPSYVLSDADVVSSIELDNDRGVTVKLGGANAHGLAFSDMKTGTEARPETTPGTPDETGIPLRQWAERNHGDLTIKLGKDAYREDPQGDGAHYWEADVEFAVGGTADAPDGTYQLWLSNRAGSVSASIDAAAYLQYAAYGLFNFMDRTLEDTTICSTGSGGNARPVACTGADDRTYVPASVRLQGLHFGFETPGNVFNTAGANNDLRDLTTSIGATYSGRTTAMAMTMKGAQAAGVAGGFNQTCQTGTCTAPLGFDVYRPATENLERMRGDVKLYACFGATAACTNADAPGGNTIVREIEGVVNGFEVFDDGAWRAMSNTDAFQIGSFDLVSTPISVSGAFGRGAIPDSTNRVYGEIDIARGNSGRGFRNSNRGDNGNRNIRWHGGWGGQFYGPLIQADSTGAAFADGDGPAELAGWWFIPAHHLNTTVHTVVGSFGAKLD